MIQILQSLFCLLLSFYLGYVWGLFLAKRSGRQLIKRKLKQCSNLCNNIFEHLRDIDALLGDTPSPAKEVIQSLGSTGLFYQEMIDSIEAKW